MSRDAIAVVIPCHNGASTLAECLDSVLLQSLAPREVVVVDDGSTDASAELVRGYEDRGVRCVSQPQSGPAAARNRGVAETGAPWVAFLDADDRFVADKLERQAAHLRATGAVLSACDAVLLRDGRLGERKRGEGATPATIAFEDLLRGNPIICSSTVVSREALLAAGGFDEAPELVATEDYDLWLRLVERGALAYLDEALVHYRVLAGSLSDDDRFTRGVDRIMAKVVERHPGDEAVARLATARRAAVRVDAAYQHLRAGRGGEARARLRAARELAGRQGGMMRLWLRSWFC